MSLKFIVALVLLLATLVGAAPSVHPELPESQLRPYIELYQTDRSSIERRYRVPMSATRAERLQRLHSEWAALVADLPFDDLSREAKIDSLLFAHHLAGEQDRLRRGGERDQEVIPLLPYWKTIVDLIEGRRETETAAPRAAAASLTALTQAVEGAEKGVRSGAHADLGASIANRAARRVDELKRALAGWYRHFAGYDPAFTWWTEKPYQAADEALSRHAAAIRKKLVQVPDGLVGDPIGRSALEAALAHEMIPYAPEELIAAAREKLAWCDVEMEKAARELGFDDWRKAQEHVKELYVAPGEQPKLIRDFALEAIDYVVANDLVTVPPLCREVWRIEMMSAEQQRFSPYFLGGEVIRVAYPTAGMSQRDKQMSLRGNNPHFSRAVVHHELIPGHHLQHFMGSRHRTHRRVFGTPFYSEGWPLYWELILWERGFARGPEDRIGMLFWQKHRCARIVFSLSYHLGEMTATKAVDFLVDRIGHERNNAVAEVRRSISGGYGPLYQAAYLLGGLQLRALRKELVESGKMTDRAFHDAVLRQNSIPIAMVRLALSGKKVTRDFESDWRFLEAE